MAANHWNLASEQRRELSLSADRVDELQGLVERIGEVVLSTTEAIDVLAQRMDALTLQLQAQGQQLQVQGQQVQQQGYQVVALSNAIQTLAENQDDSLQRLNQLTDVLQRLTTLMEQP